MTAHAQKLTTIAGLEPGKTVNLVWNNANAEVYRLNAWPVVRPGVTGLAKISNTRYVVHGNPSERELHYSVTNDGSTTIDVDVWAFFWSQTWTISASKVHANKIQEAYHDEFYIALPWLRSTPAMTGSSVSGFSGKLSEVELGDVRGENVRLIPSSMGSVSFNGVKIRTMADLLAGRMPEMFVIVSAVFESDHTPFSTTTDTFKKLANVLKKEVGVNIIEGLSISSSPDELKKQLATAITDIKNAVTPAFWEAIGIWLESGGDPDDLIKFQTTIFVAADDALWKLIESKLPNTSSDVDFRQLRQGDKFSYTFDNKNEKASYTVDYTVGIN